MTKFDVSHLNHGLVAGHAIQASAVILPDGQLIISGDKRALDLYAKQQLEAQHRKTWALAMEYTQREQTKFACKHPHSHIIGPNLDLPCPPIEATKDK